MSLTLESIAPLSVCLQHLRVLHPDPDFDAWLADQRAAAWSNITQFLDRPVFSTGKVPADEGCYLEVVQLGQAVVTLEQLAAAHKNNNQIPMAVLRAAILLYLSSANEHRESISEKPLSVNPAYLNLLNPYRRFSDKQET